MFNFLTLVLNRTQNFAVNAETLLSMQIRWFNTEMQQERFIDLYPLFPLVISTNRMSLLRKTLNETHHEARL